MMEEQEVCARAAGYPAVRLRRLRRTANVRALFADALPGPEKFIWPVFVVPGRNRKEPIASMPGQFRYSADELVKALAPVVAQVSAHQYDAAEHFDICCGNDFLGVKFFYHRFSGVAFGESGEL